jgi:hypothetical protein
MVSKLLQKSISDFKSISNKLDFHFETIDMKHFENCTSRSCRELIQTIRS